jgi:N-acetylneuraminic acid mutarotase/sugar lactone lactonase YvrE
MRAARIVVSPALDLQNQELDTTGSGTASVGAEDVSTSFTINADKTPPLVSISAGYDILFDRLPGTAITVPTTRSPTATVTIHDDVGLANVVLPGTPTVLYPADANLAALAPGTKDVVAEIAGLAPGNAYSFSAKNSRGNITQGSWRVEKLALVVNSAEAAYDQTADHFSGTINIRADSTVAAEKIIQFDPTTQAKIADHAVGPFNITVPANRANVTVLDFFSSRDIEGNSSIQSLEVYEAAYSFADGPGIVNGRLQVVGNGSVSVALPFPDNPTPAQAGMIKPGVIRVEAGDFASLDFNVGRMESNVPVPILDNPPAITFSLSADGKVLASGTMSSDFWGNVSGLTIPAAIIPVTGTVNFTATIVAASGVSGGACLEASGSTCLRPLLPVISARPPVRTLNYFMPLPQLGPHIPIYEGAGQTVSLGNGATLSGFNATSSGLLSKAAFTSAFVEEGNVNLLGDRIYLIEASSTTDAAPFFTPSFTLKLTFDPTKRTPGKAVKLARMDTCRLTMFDANAPAGGNTATAQVTGFGRYAIVESKYATVNPADYGRCHFVSGESGVSADPSTISAEFYQAINVLGSLGLKPIGTTCKLGPTAKQFAPPGELKICYDPADLTQAGVSDALTVYQFNEAGVREPLANMYVDSRRGFVTGTVSRFSSQFGAFATTTSVPASDLLPPITTLAMDGQALPGGTSFFMTTTSTLSLSAADAAFPGAPVSGVAGTFILLDTPFVDTVSTPGLPYGGPFSLDIGSHTLAYYSVDLAGNIENPHVVSVLANPPPSRGVAGLAVGRDSSNRLWTVALDNGAVTMSRTDANGVMVASAPLPQALSDGRWNLLFDEAGGVYAVGAAEGPSTQATDVAVYKASPEGGALASSGYFDGGFGAGDFVFDAAAPGWIVGAVEISEGVLKAALWRFNPANGTVSLSTAFASGAAMGVAVDADGSVWAAGYVRNPSPRSSRVYDLGLWHFASDGQTLLAGPYTREAYVADIEPTFAAEIRISSDAVNVVAPRGRPGGGTDLGMARFDKASGAVPAESAWRAADGSASYPAAVLPDGDGILAAGGLDSGATRAALWRFGVDGGLASATLAAAGGARGASAAGADLWLAVDDATAPYKVTSETALAGSLADVRPPRIELAVGVPSFVSGNGAVFVASASLLNFTSADDKLASGDGLGAGVPAVYYRADSTGAFAAFSGPFSLAAEGAHAIEFYGVDTADNPGPILSRLIAVDATAPVTQTSQNGAEITLEASDPSGAGVSGIRYLVDYGDPAVCNNVAEDTAAARGTCENPWYAGPFMLSNGPHTLSFQAFDAVGNVESLQTAYPFVDSGGNGGPSAGGMGIGKDASNELWTVVLDSGAIAFAHADSSGTMISSATLQDGGSDFPWSVLFGQDGRAYAIGAAEGLETQAMDLAIYKASPAGDAIESRTLFDSGYAKNDIVFDAKSPGWIVGAAQTSGPANLDEPGEITFSMALWRFDPTLGTVQLKTTYARGSFDLAAGLAVDPDGSLWVAGYSLSPENPNVGAFDLALWHYAANGQTLLGGPYLRPGYLNDLDAELATKVYVTTQAVYIAATRVNSAGSTDMAFLRYDKSSGQPIAETAWRSAGGESSYPMAILPEASGMLVVGGIGANSTQAALWRFGFDGALQGVTTTEAGGARGAVFKDNELWLSVDGSTVPYHVEAEAAAAGALIDLAPPRSSLSAGTPSFNGDSTVYVTSATPLGFAVVDDYTVPGDALGVGATQTFYAEGGGAFARFTSSFTLVAEGTHTVSFFSIDREGRAEAVKTQSVGVDLTAPVVSLISSGTIFTITAVDPLVGGAASGVDNIYYLVDLPVECQGVEKSTAAPPGTCENMFYAGPFELAAGTHTVYYAASDKVLNGEEIVYSSFVTVAAPPAALALTSISPMLGGNGGPVTVSVNGSGIFAGAGLALNRIQAAGFTTSGALALRVAASAVRLANGKVLIAGGQGNASNIVFSSAELFDPNTGTWSPTGSMAVTRYGHTMTLLPNGKVLVVGGTSCISCFNALGSAELYDPASGTWSNTGSLAAVRLAHTATLLANGKVLVAGGGSTNNGDLMKSSAELYDPATGVWTSAGIMPSGAHFVHSAAMLSDGRVVVAGGRNTSAVLTAAVDIYNPATNAWSAASPMSRRRSRYTLNPLPDGKLLATGGDDGTTLASTEIYDPGTGAWTAGASLSSKRANHAAVRLMDGAILVIGGSDGAGGFSAAAAEMFDPVAGSWSSVGSLPRQSHTATLLGDGSVLVAGGYDSNFLSVTSIYSPASQSIVASNLTYSDGNTIGGVLDLTGQSLGLWDVIVTNPDQSSARLSNAFTIYDMAPPSVVGDLAISALGVSTATLTWTAPSGQGGAATSYDLRRATSPITEANFFSAASITAPTPAAPGTSQTATVALGSDSSLFVALRSRDIYGNVSGISNVAGLARSATLVNGTAEASIWATQPVSIAMSTSGTASIQAAAAAQGLTQVSAIYDPNPKSVSFVGGANAAFVYDPAALSAQGIPAESLRIYQFIGGTLVALSSQTISGETLAASAASFGGVLGLFGVVPAPTITAISPSFGGNGGPMTVSVSGAGIIAGAGLELNRLLSGSGFSTSGALALRTDARAVRLANGKILIAGGQGSTSNIVFSTVEIFDPNSGTWSATGAMAVPRFGHTITLLPNGKVLVVGGTSCSNCNALNTAELYDPASGTWSYTGSLAAVRLAHTATPLANGKVLVAGGGSTSNADLIKSSAEIYDPATGVWTSAGVMPSGAHFWHAAALLPDGRVVVAGGRNSSMLLTAAVDIYNPASNTWSPAAPMSATRSRFTLDLLANGKLIATGGDAGVILASTEIFDPASGVGAWSAGAPLSMKRSVHTSVRLGNGSLLVIGGLNGSGGFSSAAELYDQAASSWSTVGSLPRLSHTETLLADGGVLIAGGYDSAFQSVTSIYRPASTSIVASSLTYSGGSTIGGVLDLTGQSVGLWDVVVTNPNRLSARLPNAFTIHGSAPPSAVTDLALSSIGLSTVTLQWTAPASPSGALAAYEIRYASFPLDSGNFASGTPVTGPAPAPAGTSQSASIGGLDGVTAFYAALKSRDVYGNISALSNVASWVRGTAAVGDQPEFTFAANVAVTAVPVSTFTAPGTVVLATATAQGLTLVSSIYDLGPEGAVFNPYARMTFVYSPAALASLGLLPGDIKIYQYVSGLGMVAVSSQTIDTAANTITGYVPSLSSIFAVFGVVKDRAAPVTSLTHGSSATFADGSGNLYASPAASFGFSAYDPVVFGTASGVARTNFRVDGPSTAPFSLYTSTFSLSAEGQRTLWFYSEDHDGNVEVVRSSGVLVDATAPVTTLQVIGSSVAGVSGGLAVSSTTTIALSAADPVSNGIASGVRGIFYALDAIPASPYAGPFALPPGAHNLSYFSKDNVANAETASVLSVLVDTVAPRSVLLVDGVPATDPGVVIVSTNSLGFSASDAGAGVAQILYSLDGAAEQVYVSTFSPSAGSHALAYRGVDRLGNAEAAHQVALDVLLYDVTSPSVALSIVDQSTITTTTPLFAATYGDDGRGVDVSSVRLTLDGADVTAQAAVNASSTTFSPVLSQGAHDLSISFADFAGNQMSAAASFFVDSLPPATILQVNGVAASTAALVVVSTDSLGFTSLDAGTGVAQTVYALDGGAPTVYGSTFSLAAGAHTLAYHSFDRVGNVESAVNVAVSVLLYDAEPPSVLLSPVAGSTVTTATPLIAAVYSDAGRGVDASTVRISLDGLDVTSEAAVSASSAVFTPSVALSQATHAVVVRVSDLAGNESFASSAFLVDSLPPVTMLLVDGLATSATSLVLISTDTIGFSATDGGSGVLQTRYALDGAPTEAVYMSTFSITAGEHTLTYRSFDLGGNEEGARTVSLSVFGLDVTPPALALVPSHGSTVTVATPLIAAVYNDLGRGIDVSSVKIFLDGINATAQAVVTASSAVFTPGAALSQGAHTVTAEVADLADNRSSSAATFFVDSIAPVTTLLVNGLATSATSLVLISTESIGFGALDAGVGTAETRYALDGSTSEVVYVSPFNLTAGAHTLAFRSRDFAGNVEAARTVSIAVLADDTTPPSLALAPVDGSTITTTTPEIGASYSDPGRGVDLSSVRISLDGQDATPSASIGASSTTFTPAAALSQGTHTVTATASDLAGNAAFALATFHVDSLPPMTTLLVNGHTAGSANLVLASTDAVSFAAVDSGVGVLETRYSVDGASEAVFTAPFFLSPGSSSLAFRSRDRAGNQEAIRTVSVTVTTPSTDTIPPLVRLDLPGVSALGVEQALGGVVDVRGAVSDASALTWTLEAAPGASATGGFTTIASGAGGVSGLIAAWNTTTLSGYQTVRLRATDAFGNSASATATVFVGGPVFTFAVGRKDSHVIVNTIKGPTGIAVRSDGAIWVASMENDKILLLSPAGVLLGEAGHAPGHSGKEKERGKKDKDDDDDEDEAEGGLSFKTPQGLALDAADNLYVADRDLNRVVKLSPDGRGLLLQVGKAGSGNGELRHPFDVAVDGNGDIYIADSGNRRIQVFNSSGGYLRQFGQGVLLSTSEVRGITLTAEGLWVSDKEQERIFLFSRAGVLLKSIGGADSAVGELSRMRGLASDRLGALYVVEPNRDRVQKFDPQGKGLLAFGSKAGLNQADKKAKHYLTQPIDAAMAPDGSIWIADTGRDRIVRYALPASGGYGTAAYAAGGGEFSSSSVEPARRVVDHKDGAKVERDDGAGVSVPKGALAADLEITVERGDENQDKEQKTAKRREMKLAAVSEEVQYGPEGTTFAAPVTLILPYDANLLASQGIKEDELKVYYWNPTLKDWQVMPSTVDKQNKTVHAQTTHFSAYQVGGLGGIGVAAVDDFGLRDGYAFPNPSRNGSPVTFRMQPGSVDSIEVRVYDLSGRKIHSSSDFRFLGAIDDGNGKGVQNTYDHVWNVSGVGSGVYTFVMTAKKAGQPDIRKTGKAGVIK